MVDKQNWSSWTNARSRTFTTQGTFSYDNFFFAPSIKTRNHYLILFLYWVVHCILILNTRYWYLADVWFFLAAISKIPAFRVLYKSIRHSSRSACEMKKNHSSFFQLKRLTNKYCVFLRASKLFVFKSVWRFLRLFRPFWLYWCICLRYKLLRFDSNLRFPLGTAKKIIPSLKLAFWKLETDVSPLEIFFVDPCTLIPRYSKTGWNGFVYVRL